MNVNLKLSIRYLKFKIEAPMPRGTKVGQRGALATILPVLTLAVVFFVLLPRQDGCCKPERRSAWPILKPASKTSFGAKFKENKKGQKEKR